MNESLRTVTDWLICSSSQVSQNYFQLPVANALDEEAKYRERVYCYELYHQWRSHWTDSFRYSLGGEIDKSGHPLIRSGAKPDFLVHVPGEMDNLLIVEIKPANAAVARMVDDLKKLTKFCRQDARGNSANYHSAYFWVYGISCDNWPSLRHKLLEGVNNSSDFDRTLVSCFVHERPGLRAVPVSWELVVSP